MTTAPRSIFGPEHDLFRNAVRQFVDREVLPNTEKWRTQGRVDRSLFEAAGKAGFMGMAAPVEFGGGGNDDIRYSVILSECFAESDVMVEGLGLTLQTDMALPYLIHHCSPQQAAAWIPDAIKGRTILALAISEPGAGSDIAGIKTTAKRVGDEYVLNGSKTFITNALNADLILVAAKTRPGPGHDAISLIAVEASRRGLSRGRKLEKVGQASADTADLFFDDVKIPAANLLGPEGGGFHILMEHLAQERLIVAVQAVAQARRAFEHAVEYARHRQAFGQAIGRFQNTRFTLAEMKTDIDVGRVYVDDAISRYASGDLDESGAAQAKLWSTEMCQRVVDRAVQIHGGYGYMLEYPVARAWADTRVQTIYAGTSEMMKEIIGRSLGL
jgi:alkylation response protein AidB-like acyl-CoA dehydrogenase